MWVIFLQKDEHHNIQQENCLLFVLNTKSPKSIDGFIMLLVWNYCLFVVCIYSSSYEFPFTARDINKSDVTDSPYMYILSSSLILLTTFTSLLRPSELLQLCKEGRIVISRVGTYYVRIYIVRLTNLIKKKMPLRWKQMVSTIEVKKDVELLKVKYTLPSVWFFTRNPDGSRLIFWTKQVRNQSESRICMIIQKNNLLYKCMIRTLRNSYEYKQIVFRIQNRHEASRKFRKKG